jgi:hypothetical protein
LDAIGLRGGLSLKGVWYAVVGVMLSSFLYYVIEGLFKAVGWRMLWRGGPLGTGLQVGIKNALAKP